MKNIKAETGIVSVTFRSYSPEEVISAAVSAGLESIEWGGDIHVPHGNIENARRVGGLTREAGLSCESYGSYYRVPAGGEGFDEVLETAKALGARSIRIWAGSKGSADTSPDERAALVRTLRENAHAAEECGMTLSFEFHGGTLTDTPESALMLLSEAGCGNIRLHWQPNQYRNLEYNIESLSKVASHVDIVHVFAWEGDGRFPLNTQREAWGRYIEVLEAECALSGHKIPVMLEFLPHETADDLLRDADELKSWLI